MDEDDPFAEYHRFKDRQRLTRIVATVVPIAVVVGLVAWASASGATSTPMPVPTESTSGPSPSPSSSLPAENDLLPVDPQPQATPTTEPTVASGPRDWTIDIDTTGFQAELDRCLWVRMDLQAAAPIVGAHNYCGGGIVLEMAEGDTVTLAGTGLDGTYRVTGEREAHAGDVAADATAGFVADVILQTCHWKSSGRERLLSLVLV